MVLTFGSALTNILFGCIVISVIAALLRNKKLITIRTLTVFLIVLLLNILRMVFPVELFFARTIGIKKILPEIYSFFHMPIFESSITIGSLLMFVWLSVAGMKGIVTIVKYRQLRRLVNTSPEILPPIDISINELKNKNIKIIKFDIDSPIIMGLIKPLIIIPDLPLNEKEMSFILRHEIQHYRHRDLWFKMMFEIVSIIYWWNPYTLFIRKQLNKVTEIHNDLSVTSKMSEKEKLDYLQCLLKVARRQNSSHDDFSLAFGENESLIQERVETVLNNTKRKNLNKFVVISFLAITIITYFITIEPKFTPPDCYDLEDFKGGYFISNEKGTYTLILDDKVIGTAINPENLGLPIIEKDDY